MTHSGRRNFESASRRCRLGRSGSASVPVQQLGRRRIQIRRQRFLRTRRLRIDDDRLADHVADLHAIYNVLHPAGAALVDGERADFIEHRDARTATASLGRVCLINLLGQRDVRCGLAP